jgi:protein-L-isoaspartate(D-aspartate) O-methyltransferase
MIARDLRGRGIAGMRVLEAFDAVHRHRFIPDVATRDAYGDFPFSIGLKQTVSQPYIVALMVELAGIRSGDRVLEIGTGCGFQTAILAHLTPEVFTVEIIPELLERARATLGAVGCETVRSRLGDGHQGWEEEAPFDAIIVSAAPASVPPAGVWGVDNFSGDGGKTDDKESQPTQNGKSNPGIKSAMTTQTHPRNAVPVQTQKPGDQANPG